MTIVVADFKFIQGNVPVAIQIVFGLFGILIEARRSGPWRKQRGFHVCDEVNIIILEYYYCLVIKLKQFETEKASSFYTDASINGLLRSQSGLLDDNLFTRSDCGHQILSHLHHLSITIISVCYYNKT